jgi:hypothetical protein
MSVVLTTPDSSNRKPAPLGIRGAAYGLAVALVVLTLLGSQYRQPDRSDVASADAEGRAQSEDCLPDGSGSLSVVLSGAVQYDIEWNDEGMKCGGMGSSDMIVGEGEPRMVLFQSVQFQGVPAVASSPVDLMFNIQVEEGATGAGLSVKVGINDNASGRYFATSEWGGCTADVTEQSVIDENPAFRRYRLAVNGSCVAPSVQYAGPGGAGASEITVGDFEFIGIAIWMGPRD